MIGQELVLSKSSIDSFAGCGYRYYLGYVLRIRTPANLDMLTGTAVHSGVEAYWRHQEPYDATRAAFVYDGPLDATTTSEMVVASLFDATAMTELYIEKIVPTFPVPPTIIEADFLVRIDGALVSGRIDVADTTDVHDTKTTSTPSKVDPAHHRLGMTIYRWGYKALTGHLPGRLLLDIVARNGRFAVKPVEPDDQGMADTVGVVGDAIRAGRFEPTGQYTGACRYCPFASGLCSYAKLD